MTTKYLLRNNNTVCAPCAKRPLPAVVRELSLIRLWMHPMLRSSFNRSILVECPSLFSISLISTAACWLATLRFPA